MSKIKIEDIIRVWILGTVITAFEASIILSIKNNYVFFAVFILLATIKGIFINFFYSVETENNYLKNEIAKLEKQIHSKNNSN